MSNLVIEEIRQYISVDDTASTVLTITDEQVSVVEVGIQGPQGQDGNTVGADKTFSQSFSSSSFVSITHNLGKYPSVTVIDSAGDEVVGDVVYVDMNHLTIQFSAPFSGTATLN